MLELVFWLSALGIVYTYAGYPVLIGIAARLMGKPIKRAAFEPELTVIIAAHNEAETIGARLENILDQDYPPEKLTIIVASDGSTDATNETVRAFHNDCITLLAFEERRGKAACLNDAVEKSSTDFIVFADARQRFDKAAIRSLLENFADPGVGAVSGELVIDAADSGFSQGIDFYWRYEKFIRQSEARFDSVVGVTGAIYALRKSCFRKLPHGLILDDVLVPMNATRAGSRVGFEPRAIAYDVAPPSPEWEHRRKVRTLAGNYQLVQMSPGLLAPWRNPIWLQFISHKIMRLVAPALLIAALLTNLLLASDSALYTTLLVAQAAFYAAAVTGLLAPASQGLAAVRIPMTFCLLNWSAVLGCREYIARRSAHLW